MGDKIHQGDGGTCQALEGLGSYWDPGSVPLSTASYLPRPRAPALPVPICELPGLSIWAESRFQFQEPRPMDEQVTLKKTDGGTDIMLVVPKATVLQVRTEQQSCSWARN